MGRGMSFHLDNSSYKRFAYKLDKLKSSAFPNVIRKTINDAVFDVKTRSMPLSSRSEFTIRQKNFFTANSKFEPAKGMNLKTMQATVGFYENKLKDASTNYAVKELEQQEKGGTIDSRTFIPTRFARKGQANTGLVRPNARLKAIRQKGIVDAKYIQGKKGQRFFKAVSIAGVGGYVLYSDLLWWVRSVDGKVKAVPLYSVKKGRSVSVKRTEFMKDASLDSQKRMDQFFIKHANSEFKKYYGTV